MYCTILCYIIRPLYYYQDTFELIDLSPTYLELMVKSCYSFTRNSLGKVVDLCPQAAGLDFYVTTSDELIQSIVDKYILSLFSNTT